MSRAKTITVDATCRVPDCELHRGSYVMVGKCLNCKALTIEITYSRGNPSVPVHCPLCGVLAVVPQQMSPYQPEPTP